MKMISSGMLIGLVSLMLCAGCSVKENRDLCPCRLVLDFSEVDTSVVRSADLVVTADGGFVFTDGLEPEDFRSDYVLDVPRGEMTAGVWSGTEGMWSAGGLEIPYGEDCPPVYFHTSVFEAHGNGVRETVFMRKNHCRMTVVMNNMDVDPKGMRVFGDVSGYMPDGTPSSGKFSCRLQQDGKGGHLVILPRQTDNSLSMEVDDGSGVAKRFALGEYIAESGYDWNAADLEDLVIEIDVTFTGIILVVQGWDSTHRFDIVI